MGFIANTSFSMPEYVALNNRLFGWFASNLAAQVQMLPIDNTMGDAPPRTGTGYMSMLVHQAGGSVAHDFDLNDPLAMNPPTQSISVLAWVRAPTAGAAGAVVSGTLTLWQLDKSHSKDIQNMDRDFSIDVDDHDKWIMIENTLDIQAVNGTYNFRVEIYQSSVDVMLDIDTVMVF